MEYGNSIPVGKHRNLAGIDWKKSVQLPGFGIIIEVNIVTIDGPNGGPKAYKPISVDARPTKVRKKDVFFVGFFLYSFRS
jgi:hypothetical protein